MRTFTSILGYAHTPGHLPAGLYILGGILLLWLISRLGSKMTFGDLCAALGFLGVGAGVVIWALRWKPGVTNTTTNTYPAVNHNVTTPVIIHSSGGLGLWQEILMGLGVAVTMGFAGWIFRHLH